MSVYGNLIKNDSSVDILSLIDTTANNTGSTLYVDFAYRFGNLCMASGSLAAPSSATNYSGKVLFTMDSSIKPIKDCRFIGYNGVTSPDQSTILYIDRTAGNLRFTGDSKNQSISTTQYFTVFWIIA